MARKDTVYWPQKSAAEQGRLGLEASYFVDNFAGAISAEQSYCTILRAYLAL